VKGKEWKERGRLGKGVREEGKKGGEAKGRGRVGKREDHLCFGVLSGPVTHQSCRVGWGPAAVNHAIFREIG